MWNVGMVTWGLLLLLLLHGASPEKTSFGRSFLNISNINVNIRHTGTIRHGKPHSRVSQLLMHRDKLFLLGL